MKKLAIVFIGLFLMAFSMNVNAQNTNAADGTASAVIQTPLTIELGQDLVFGRIGPATTGGSNTVTINTLGGRSIGVGGNGQLISGITPQAALFNISGESNNAYTIAVSGLTEISNGSEVMPISTFTTRADSETADGPNGVLSGGTGSVAVGATITVAQGQATGTYEGDFTVTVNYQ